MADTRFPWARVDKLSAALELRKRNVKRILVKDSGLHCILCKRVAKRGDECFYPAYAVGSDNKTIAHAACVDKACGEVSAKAALSSPTIVIKEETAARKVEAVDILAKIEKAKKELRDKVWQDACSEGYEAGVAAVLAQLAGGDGKLTI